MTKASKTRRWVAPAAVLVAVVALSAACGSDGDGGGADGGGGDESSSATTSERDDVLDILITNDDGYDAPGLSQLVQSLFWREDTVVTVVAPAEPQSQPNTTDPVPPVEYLRTAGDYPVVAVSGSPADSVEYALTRVLGEDPPDVVISGVDAGQNVGLLAPLSGTFAGAQAGARAGIPSVAVGQGTDQVPPEFERGVIEVVNWLTDKRDELIAGELPPQIVNLNIPSCATGEVRNIRQVPIAVDDAGRDSNAVDCTSVDDQAADDIDAFTKGFVSMTIIEVTPEGEGEATATTLAE